MLRNFGLTLLAIVGLFAAGSANAVPFYTNEASWLAALPSNANIVASVPGTTTTTVTTVEIRPDGTCCIVLGQTITSVPSVSSVVGDFSFASGCEIFPGCVITGTTDITVTFSTPVLGFTSDLVLLGNDIEELNGLPLPGGGSYNGFYGVVGPFSSLDFQNRFQFTDNMDSIDLTFTAFAIVGEPSTFASLVAALIILALAAPRLRQALFNRAVASSR